MSPILAALRTLDNDDTSFILTMLIGIVASFFFNLTGILLLGISSYIILRWLQRPWTQIDHESL